IYTGVHGGCLAFDDAMKVREWFSLGACFGRCKTARVRTITRGGGPRQVPARPRGGRAARTRSSTLITWGHVPSGVFPCGPRRGPGKFLRRASVRETGDMDSMSGISRGISDLSEWIDEANSQLPPEAATWARLAKITEEAGEVVTAHIGATGQNP